MSVTAPAQVAVPTAPRPPSARRSLFVLVRRGLLDHRRAPLTWGGGLGAMSALMAAIWPSVEDSMSEVIDNYPAGLKDAFGIESLDTVEQYIDAEMLSLIVPLALIFFTVRCATRATVGAEEHRHLDTLLSLPVSRRVLVWSAFTVTAVMAAVILAVVFVMTWSMAALVGAGMSSGALVDGLVNVWPLAMIFAGLAVFAAGRISGPATVTAIGAGGGVAMYVVDLVGKLAPSIEDVRVISPFRYYGSAVNNGLDASHVFGLAGVAIVLTAIGAELFERRDLS